MVWIFSVGSEVFFLLFKLLVEDMFEVCFWIIGVLFWIILFGFGENYVWIFFDNISLLNVEK